MGNRSKALWAIVGGLALVASAGFFAFQGRKSSAKPPAAAEGESQPAAPAEVVPLPAELAPIAAKTAEIVARFDAAAKTQGFEGWPALPAALSTCLADPTQTRLFANPRALILMGPEPGRLDALVLVKQVHPQNPEEPYLPILVRHLESNPTFHHPWGPSDNTPWGTQVTSSDDEIWGWIESKSQHQFGSAYRGLMVVKNEPGRLWLAPEGTDEIATWFYGFGDRLAYEVDDLEDATGKPEHTADDEAGEGVSTLKRADFDRAQDYGSVWTRHIFEVDGRLYETDEKNWQLWKQGPPASSTDHVPAKEDKP